MHFKWNVTPRFIKRKRFVLPNDTSITQLQKISKQAHRHIIKISNEYEAISKMIQQFSIAYNNRKTWGQISMVERFPGIHLPTPAAHMDAKNMCTSEYFISTLYTRWTYICRIKTYEVHFNILYCNIGKKLYVMQLCSMTFVQKGYKCFCIDKVKNMLLYFQLEYTRRE